MKPSRTSVIFLLAVALTAASFIAGTVADVSMRDPHALAASTAMVAFFFALVLYAR